MINNYLYYKYVVRPQVLLKFPKKNNFLEIPFFTLRKIRLNMFLLDMKQNSFLYLYNICILMRLLFNKYLYIKKVNKYYTLNKVHIQLCIENDQIFIFLDIFANILLPLFETFNMGLKERNFDMFGNYLFEFNYCDPIFMSKNTVIVWSTTNKVRIIFYFFGKDKKQNMLLLRYLNLRYHFLK